MAPWYHHVDALLHGVRGPSVGVPFSVSRVPRLSFWFSGSRLQRSGLSFPGSSRCGAVPPSLSTALQGGALGVVVVRLAFASTHRFPPSSRGWGVAYATSATAGAPVGLRGSRKVSRRCCPSFRVQSQVPCFLPLQLWGVWSPFVGCCREVGWGPCLWWTTDLRVLLPPSSS